MYQRKANARMRPCACIGWSGSHFTHVRRHFFAWRGQIIMSFIYMQILEMWIHPYKQRDVSLFQPI